MASMSNNNNVAMTKAEQDAATKRAEEFACCPPGSYGIMVMNDYEPKGSWQEIAGMKAYVVMGDGFVPIKGKGL